MEEGKTSCRCGQVHDAITREQVIAAEMRGPLKAKKDDPFPQLIGNRTVDFSTRWRKGGVLLSDKAAALCTTPDELNREEAAAEGELVRHVNAGLVPIAGLTPPWARDIRSAPVPDEPKDRGGRPKKTRKKETAPRNLTPEQRRARAASTAKARAGKNAKRIASSSDKVSPATRESHVKILG